MEVRRIIVHAVKKEQHNHEAEIQFRPAALPLNEKLKGFAEELEKVYKSKPGKIYGIFEADTDTFQFQNYLKNYIQSDTDQDFIVFAKQSTNLFKEKLRSAQASTGGYLFFLDYIINSTRYLAIIVVTDKHGYVLSPETLDMLDNISLDIEHLAMGARINCTRLTEGEETKYLSFLRGTKGITEYFISFIGCKNYQSNRESTNLVIHAFYDYCNQNNFDPAERRNLEELLYDELKGTQEVDLSAIARRIDPNTDEFLTIMLEKEISDGFSPDKNIIKKLKRVRYRSAELSIDFSKTLLDSGRIQYNESDQCLVIRDKAGVLKKAIQIDE